MVLLLFSGYWSQRLISNGAGSNGYDDRLIEEEEAEEGADSLEVAIKCAEIQNAISVGATSFFVYTVQAPQHVYGHIQHHHLPFPGFD